MDSEPEIVAWTGQQDNSCWRIETHLGHKIIPAGEWWPV